MSYALIIIGVFITAIGIATSIWFPSAAPTTTETAEAKPKTNDHRIVQMTDGTYQIQYYWEYPGWRSYNVEYKSEEAVRRGLSAIESPNQPRPTVDKVLPQ